MAWLPLIFDGAGRLASLSLPTALVGACWLPGRNHRPKTYTERDALKFEEVKKKLKKYLLDRNRRENWNLEVLTRMQELWGRCRSQKFLVKDAKDLLSEMLSTEPFAMYKVFCVGSFKL